MVAAEPNALELAGLRFQIGIFEEAIARRPDDVDALRFLAHAYSMVGRRDEALATDRRLVELLPKDPRVRYNLACSCVLSGRLEDGLGHLEAACELGFDDLALLRRDDDLDPLRETERFAAIEREIARRQIDGKGPK
jgi:tetratricopeptide (TPR) repeat protein